MADEKILKDEHLTDEHLDSVAGGVYLAAHIVRQSEQAKRFERATQSGNISNGDERDDVEQANMSAAFINGDITGGEDF